MTLVVDNEALNSCGRSQAEHVVSSARVYMRQ